MKLNKTSKKLSMAALAAAMAVAPAINVFAAPEDIIDTSRSATLTIHKYDVTAATNAGLDASQFTSNGKKNANAEAALQKYAIEGVEFTYQKVGDICTDSVNGNVQVVYDIPKELEDILGLTDERGDHKHTSDQINAAMKTILADNTASKNKLEDYIKGGHGATAMPLTDSDGVSQATSLPLGLYLLVETKVPANVNTTVDPFFVSLPMTDVEGEAWFYDVDVYPKNQTSVPDLDKLVRQHDDAALYNKAEFTDTATVSEGDTIDYILVSHLPKITSKATYLTKYTFMDKISKGLVYNRDAAIYFYDNEKDARANNVENAVVTWTKDSSNFKQNYNAAYEKASQVSFEMSTEGLAALNKQAAGSQESEFSQKWMVVSYSVTMSSDTTPILGDTGNTNDANLTWQRTNMDDSDTLDDRARVFTYGISLKKSFKSDDPSKVGDPTKTNFVLQNKTDGHYVTARQINPGSGVYYITDSIKGAAEENGTVFIPAADGSLIINGLEANDYVLTELRTDAGFNLLKEPINISIKCTQDEFTPSRTTIYDADLIAGNQNKQMIEVNNERASATVDGNKATMDSSTITTNDEDVQIHSSTNSLVKMSVTNAPGFTLPATGGAGTIAFTVAGCAVAFAGIAIVTKKSKKHEEK